MCCHAQALDELSVDAFRKHGRVGNDEGFWLVTLVVDRCAACRPRFGVLTYESWAHRFGIDTGEEFSIALTCNQYAEAMTSSFAGAVADAPARQHNGNIQLANMRGNKIVGDKSGEDPLYKASVFQVWPFLAALMASEEADRSTFDNGWMCCVRRTARLRHCKFVQTRPRSKPALADPPAGSADQQIFGPAAPADGDRSESVDGKNQPSRIPFVTLVCDRGEGGVQGPEDALGAKYGPTSVDMGLDANTPERVDEAVLKRITEKDVPLNLNDQERQELMDIADAFGNELRESKMLQNIASWILFGNLKSTKWTMARAEMALNVLMWQWMPEYVFKAAIKLQFARDDQHPRLLIADGDAGAVMSALTIGVLERYVCHYHKRRTIKGVPKSLRMQQICEEAFEMANASEAFPAFMMENDGSAWDTCCKFILRCLTENRVLDVVMDELYQFFVPYNMFQDARKKADRKKTFNLQVQTNKVSLVKFNPGCKYTCEDTARVVLKKCAMVKIDAIRRSGDRGTTILNWIINVICWAWVMCGCGGHKLVHVNGKVCLDIFGNKRRFRFWMEGDDSLLWLTGRQFAPGELDELAARWSQLGHRPKLFMRVAGDVAEFTGWKFVVNKYGLDGATAVPDVPRLLKNCFYTTCKEAVVAAREGDALTFGRVVGPALVARAGPLAERVPSIARWLYRMSRELARGTHLDDAMFTRDDMYRLGSGDMVELLPEWWKNDDPAMLFDTRYGTFCDNVSRQISNSVASGGIEREATLAVRHGWVKTSCEWFEFVQQLDVVGYETSDTMFRSILPPGMK